MQNKLKSFWDVNWWRKLNNDDELEKRAMKNI